MNIFIGIDQSINSTGITVKKIEDNVLVDTKFYIIHNSKLTKKEKYADENLNNFEYLLYDKLERAEAKTNNDIEHFKLMNNINIANIICNLLCHISDSIFDNIFIGMEGISFNSSQSKSLVDLAGLSYIIRYCIYHSFMENNIIDKKYSLSILTPGEIKKFATGNGNAKKESMIQLFTSLHNELKIIPKIDDLADSYWICEYLIHIISQKNNE